MCEYDWAKGGQKTTLAQPLPSYRIGMKCLAFFFIVAFAFNSSLFAQGQNESFIREGDPGEAQTLSGKKSALVLHISGGNGEKYSALQYAQMLQIMFNDSTRTKHPIKPYVVYEESGQDRSTGAMAYIKGRRFDKNGGVYEQGDSIFLPVEIVKYIPIITQKFTELKEVNKRGL